MTNKATKAVREKAEEALIELRIAIMGCLTSKRIED